MFDFDTNDYRLVEPLWGVLVDNCNEVLFVDHHPVLTQGPLPTAGSYINTDAASTGEVAFYIIQELGLQLDSDVARALYTSISFDTQLFRYVKARPNSHIVAAELLKYEDHPEIIHKEIFSTYTVGKMKFLSEALGDIEYFHDERVAVLHIRDGQLKQYHLEIDDSRDVIDMIMNITTVEAAALFREDAPGEFKISLRSKGIAEVLSIAETFGGGGHRFAAGAPTHGNYQQIKQKVVELIANQLNGQTTNDDDSKSRTN
ncbi:MAG: DHHA1 domain-containing protein [Bdellovibrionales bacterium]